jgi:xylulokinase
VLVAGIDSSTQSCKVVVRDAETGTLVREGRAAHPDGTEIHPDHWWTALLQAIRAAGGLDGVAALSVAGQQHAMVPLDDSGAVVRPALLWNDTRSAPQAQRLIDQHGGPQAWADAVGLVPVASFTVTKLAWMAEHEPGNARRTAAVCLPHDWLTWRLTGAMPSTSSQTRGRSRSRSRLEDLATDRGDASGTGYFSAATGRYRRDLLAAALGHDTVLPKVLGPFDVAGRTIAAPTSAATALPGGIVLGPGTGDNMAAALGVDARPGDVIVSVGTSGVVSAVTDVPAADPTGTVAGFADASGGFLPLVCTLNATRVLDSTARLLGVGLDELSRLALSAPAGAGGLALVPYFEGERTPNRPDATGALHGLRLETATPAYLARAAVEGLLCGLADGLDALAAQGARIERVLLVGGGARSAALRRIAPAVLGRPVVVPSPGEYVADGAARQAAGVLAGGVSPVHWERSSNQVFEADPVPQVRERYAAVRELTASAPAPLP